MLIHSEHYLAWQTPEMLEDIGNLLITMNSVFLSTAWNKLTLIVSVSI